MTDELLADSHTEDDPYSNISQWSLEKFRQVYSDDIEKPDIWEYLYGVMHAPDWRSKFRTELQKNLPRIPLAPGGFEVFQTIQFAGRELFSLHADYESGIEADLALQLDDLHHFLIENRMGWENDKATLKVNTTCRIVDIPPEAHAYQVSGRSPLEWAVDSLRVKFDKKSGIRDDVNEWRAWKDDKFELIRHLRRLAHIGIRSTEIIDSLPPTLPSVEIV